MGVGVWDVATLAPRLGLDLQRLSFRGQIRLDMWVTAGLGSRVLSREYVRECSPDIIPI